MKFSYKGPKITIDFEGSNTELHNFIRAYEDIMRQSWKEVEKNGEQHKNTQAD